MGGTEFQPSPQWLAAGPRPWSFPKVSTLTEAKTLVFLSSQEMPRVLGALCQKWGQTEEDTLVTMSDTMTVTSPPRLLKSGVAQRL